MGKSERNCNGKRNNILEIDPPNSLFVRRFCLHLDTSGVEKKNPGSRVLLETPAFGVENTSLGVGLFPFVLGGSLWSFLVMHRSPVLKECSTSRCLTRRMVITPTMTNSIFRLDKMRQLYIVNYYIAYDMVNRFSLTLAVGLG